MNLSQNLNKDPIKSFLLMRNHGVFIQRLKKLEGEGILAKPTRALVGILEFMNLM